MANELASKPDSQSAVLQSFGMRQSKGFCSRAAPTTGSGACRAGAWSRAKASPRRAREVWEETGLRVRVTRLLGVYTSPDLIVEYPDGNKFQIVGFSFEAQVMGGELGLSDETTDYGYFTPDQIESMDLMEHHRERIADALAGQTAAFVR